MIYESNGISLPNMTQTATASDCTCQLKEISSSNATGEDILYIETCNSCLASHIPKSDPDYEPKKKKKRGYDYSAFVKKRRKR
jgi:hypothetical protein